MRFQPKKSLGQHFLRNQRALQAIVNAARIKPRETVLEIGPGQGELTALLAKKAGQVIGIEKDTRLVKFLRQKFAGQKNIEIIYQDILKTDFKALGLQTGHYKLLGNLPYYLTGKVLENALEIWPKPELIVFLLQKEVALKLAAQKRFSILGVISQLLAKIEIVQEVEKKYFWPQPKVDSAVVRLIPKKRNVFLRQPELKKLIKTGFSSPRKYLISNLSRGLEIPKQDLISGFRSLGLDLKERAENLSPQTWLRLAGVLQKQKPEATDKS